MAVNDALAQRVARDAAQESEPTRKLLFVARNRQVEECGEPPQTHEDDHAFASYFANRFGEQAVFTYNRKKKNGVLRFGDMRWSWASTIKEPEDIGRATGIEEELRFWLMACWCSCTGDAMRDILRAVKRGQDETIEAFARERVGSRAQSEIDSAVEKVKATFVESLFDHNHVAER